MPCERCCVQFTVLRRRRTCQGCYRHFCSGCVWRQAGQGQYAIAGPLCGSCRVLLARPLPRRQLDALRVRDLQCFLHSHHVSTAGCVEKEDLVNLVVTHVNNGDFVRKTPTQSGQSDFSQTFAQIKGFTANLFHQAFDIGGDRSHNKNKQNAQATANQSNASVSSSSVSQNVYINPNPTTSQDQHISQSNFNRPQSSTPASSTVTSPVSEPVTISQQLPQCIVTDTTIENNVNENANLTDTNDCLEIEDDPDDPDWEILTTLPQDSEVLLLDDNSTINNVRAVSDLDLTSIITDDSSGETSSLKDAPIASNNNPRSRINLGDLKDLSDIEKLKVKQLKELLILNRVDFKGCCERKELLERAKRLWRESTKSKEDLESTSNNEELCKICMDAPMECIMLECGHIATCINCGKRLHECPICREYVVRVVRFFRS